MKRIHVILFLTYLCLLLVSCSSSSETVITKEEYDILSEEIEYLESENTRLENELWETAGKYDERIFELIQESADFEEQAIEAEEKVEYYENLVKQHNLPTYEEAQE